MAQEGGSILPDAVIPSRLQLKKKKKSKADADLDLSEHTTFADSWKTAALQAVVLSLRIRSS